MVPSSHSHRKSLSTVMGFQTSEFNHYGSPYQPCIHIILEGQALHPGDRRVS